MSVSFHRSVGQQDADPGLTWRRAGVEGLLLLVAAGRRVAHRGGLGADLGRVGGVGLLGATGALGLGLLLHALFVGDRSARAGVVVVDAQRELGVQRIHGGARAGVEVGQHARRIRGESSTTQASDGQSRQGQGGTGMHGVLQVAVGLPRRKRFGQADGSVKPR